MIQWYGPQILKEIQTIAEFSEKASAERIKIDAISKCPGKSGDLRNSIRVEKSRYKDGGYIVIAGNENVTYASYIELGTPYRGTWGVKKKPFMRPAKKAEEKKFLKHMKAKLT